MTLFTPLTLSQAEAAAQLGICVKQLRAEVDSLRLRYIMLGKRRRFVPADLETYLADRRAEWDAAKEAKNRKSLPGDPAPRSGTKAIRSTVIGFAEALERLEKAKPSRSPKVKAK